jgi:hypothetical protein
MSLAAAVTTSAFGQNPKREVVFTMNTHEVIYENEYVLYQTFSQNHFACVTRDTITKDFTFIFNGERIKIASGNGDKTDGEWHLCYANPGEVKGYIYAYKENGRWFINYRGATNGGFDDVRCTYSFSGPDQELYTPERDYDYLYKLADRWYADKNGENKRIDFIEKIYEDGRYYLNINGAIVGPYGSVSNIRLTGNGKYAYSYRNNGKYYVNVNDSLVGGPYEHDISGLALTGSGKYAYGYSDNGRWYEDYININGITIGGPYGDVSNLAFIESGKYAYSYRTNKKHYVSVGGFIVGGPYEYDVDCLALAESGEYAYSYKTNEKYYVNINGSIIGGPYKHGIRNLTFTGSGKYSYRFYENRKHYINTNGVVTEEKDYLAFENGYDDLDLTSGDGKHSFSSSYEYEYVVIDGRPYGQSPAIGAWYDESKNAFIRSAVENRELAVYEYKLK